MFGLDAILEWEVFAFSYEHECFSRAQCVIYGAGAWVSGWRFSLCRCDMISITWRCFISDFIAWWFSVKLKSPISIILYPGFLLAVVYGVMSFRNLVSRDSVLQSFSSALHC